MMNHNMNQEEKTAVPSGQNQEITEQERIDSVFPEQTGFKTVWRTLLNYIVSCTAGAVILIALYYENYLVSYLLSEVSPYLAVVDDSAGFLPDMLTGAMHLIFFTLIAVLFDFALNIDFSGHGRPREIWGKSVRFICAAAFGSCLVYVLLSHFINGRSFRVEGSLLSQCLYYFTMIVIVPAANVLLYLVLPYAVIRMLLTVVSDTKDRAELPLLLTSTAVMAIAMLGITPQHIQNYGLSVAVFALIQSAACSLLYQRTNVIKYVILMYAGVSAFYLCLTFVMNLI